MKDLRVIVAVCADKNVEIGLHVTLYSLLENTARPVRIYLVQHGYGPEDLRRLQKTLAPFDSRHELRVIEYSPERFAQYRGLHGNKFAFTRIHLAQLLKEERVVYLDSDLAVHANVADLFDSDLGGYTIGVPGVGRLKDAVEHEFFCSLGLDPDARYFNSGVMVMDLDRWRRSDISEKCIDFADRHPKQLMTADQTVLNYVFHKNNFCELEWRYNHALYANTRQNISCNDKHIFHFVGAPKPWDFLGEYVNSNYFIFRETLLKTEFRRYRSYLSLSPRKLHRLLLLSRSYIQAMRKRNMHKQSQPSD